MAANLDSVFDSLRSLPRSKLQFPLFRPGEVDVSLKGTSDAALGKDQQRLESMIANKELMNKLPDGGQKLRVRLDVITAEIANRAARKIEKQNILIGMRENGKDGRMDTGGSSATQAAVAAFQETRKPDVQGGSMEAEQEIAGTTMDFQNDVEEMLINRMKGLDLKTCSEELRCKIIHEKPQPPKRQDGAQSVKTISIAECCRLELERQDREKEYTRERGLAMLQQTQQTTGSYEVAPITSANVRNRMNWRSRFVGDSESEIDSDDDAGDDVQEG